MTSTAPDRERFHLTVSSTGRPVIQGWWENDAVARGKFVSWVGEYGTIPGARLTLVDEAAARTLAVWPDAE
ncbi:hypothetical protein [Streptomyces sp. NPDC090798]|uniref:hypothetical protein n=1 Tax=Streptomyces sp. NPDC090798 TaxID=3365968 RepID=UPI000EB11537